MSGSSKIFNLGLISYSNESKVNVLGVPKKIITKYGAVSEQVCKTMVKNVSKIAKTQISVSITGIAGPGGGTKYKPIGLVFIGIRIRGKINIVKKNFKGTRTQIQKKCVNFIFNYLDKLI